MLNYLGSAQENLRKIQMQCWHVHCIYDILCKYYAYDTVSTVSFFLRLFSSFISYVFGFLENVYLLPKNLFK